MSNKQTAVEWLFDQINDALIDFTEGKISASIYGIRVTEYKHKAKEMHKQEIKDAYRFGLSDEYVIGSQKYYNETFVAQK
jgi:hypothetical protein